MSLNVQGLDLLQLIYNFIWQHMSNQQIMTLSLTARQSRNRSGSKGSFRNRASSEKEQAKRNYIDFTNLTKNQQNDIVKGAMTTRKQKQWKYDHYRTNTTFSIYPKKQLEAFPHNNEKYNIQFLDRSLHGRNFNNPRKDWGYFQKPQDKLYSEHYKPIVRQKRSYNEDYELRTSLFGQTWVEMKKDRLLDEYSLQANPFRTPASNALISTMRKDRFNFRRL